MHTLKLFRAICLVATILTGAIVSPAVAEVRLPKVFATHMVLQQEKPIVVWGWAQPNETVTVTIDRATSQAQANDRGEWKTTLPAMKAAGPFTLKVTGSSSVQFDDVMIGEVWLCSGQSNMEMGIGAAADGEREIAAADHPGIRLLLVAKKWDPLPQTDIDGEWKVCSPKTVAEGGWSGFSAAAYYFGRELNARLGVTIGLIDASWGGTRIEPWTPPEGFAAVPALAGDYNLVQLADPATPQHQERLKQALDDTEKWLASARKALTDRTIVPPMPSYPADLLAPHDVQNATALYNGMIHPLVCYGIRGAIWYQGEANLGEGMHYADRMKGLIGGWRNIWKEGEFPFYFVQIAPYNYGGNPDKEAEFWEGQAAAAQSIPNTGMAVINDIGNLKDIHPKDKQDVGHRLALLALAKTYGHSDVAYSGPTLRSMKVEDNRLRLSFDNIDAGLATRDGAPPDWFEIIDADEGGFVKADAQIDGATIVLSALDVKHPVAMRYAWSMLAEPNLMNSDRLPTGAFRAGTIPKRDLLAMKIPEAKEYRLVYDLDLGKLGRDIQYNVDNHQSIAQPFDRIAYFVELQENDGNTDYLYVSMDAFTTDLQKIGVPTVQSGAHFQQNVANLDVFSNVKGIETGSNLPGGNIEFWPNNYAPNNAAMVPNASNDAYDFGDEPVDPPEGYGSMQVHNHDAKQTLFAINHWTEGAKADIGIGNQPQNSPDWTFSASAGNYPVKRLRVLVHCR
ncbi:MAG TPA: sialate O-acetylesterase [Verrucomicrobiae bacterium]|jgi:sialate O-acetylesterase|nr:sialate O-acetylesterase [Verrucomicrobiae bacterium]